MKLYLSIWLCLIFVAANAQEDLFKGRITDGHSNLESAHILNLSKELQTISDANGAFEISADVSDTLVITFLGYSQLNFLVTEAQLSAESNLIELSKDGIPLEEVTVEGYRAMDAVALGLINKRPKKLTTNERKLKEAGDFKAVQLLGIVGGGVPIIPMLNKITGRTKRLKKRVAVENENLLKEYLHENYGSFCSKRLGLEGEQIDRFLYFAVINHDWDDLYPHAKEEQFEFRLIQAHQKYTASLLEESSSEKTFAVPSNN
ncbi:carboxypeptidase-like regulatory domain-containing protein [Robertkochia marina]|uniref:carboxypeptidase-like regulatory domain-containing protein n=1 Tax=Robertkochia marina TaxID=1227945 RepID=UPI001454E3CB|nr:carboxypeptidase-like regulatory domain-containing protein [Robertkochia marina]